MKKAAVATTATKGTVVNSSKATAVQSVYIRSGRMRRHHLRQHGTRTTGAAMFCLPLRWSSLAVALLVSSALGQATRAQIRFDDCQPVAGGGITCNTVPYGNTRMQMIDGEYGLLDQASPGWAEYDPYEGYEDMLGGNQT